MALRLPFALVDATPQHDEPTPVVACEDGTLLRGASVSPGEKEAGMATESEFAFAVCVRHPEQEEVSTTHSWCRAAANDWLRKEAKPAAACWLLRFSRDDQPPLLLRGPEPVLVIPSLAKPRAILSDLGMVLMSFSRPRFASQISLLGGIPWPTEAEAELDTLRLAFESGSVSEDQFADAALNLLGLPASDRVLLEHIWPCIFDPIPASLALMRNLAAAPDTTLIVVSNTDPWCARACQNQFGLADLLKDGVYSFAPGVHPKGQDASMWLEASRRAADHLGAEPQSILAVDDIGTYLQQAKESGAATQTHRFTSPEHFSLFLRNGGWIPPLQLS